MVGKLGLAFSTLGPAEIVACPTCGHARSISPWYWLMIGFLGQAIFTARFLAQWIASEKRRDSVVPVVFWWLSLFGGLTLLVYAIHRLDPVIIVGQSMGVFIYVRNLMLVAKGRRRLLRRQAREEAKAQPGEQPLEKVEEAPPSTASAVPRPHGAAIRERVESRVV